MIYANDQWVQLPVKDLYDNKIMLASINAARDMYEKGLQEIKDFNKEYGNFYSPIKSDMDWYNQNVIGKVKDTINQLYANGIDPVRSAEGRAAISRVIGSVDTGKVNWYKQRAENALQWYKNMGILKSKGLYNEDFSNFLGENPQNWAENSVGSTSPTEIQSLKALTEASYNNRTPHLLTQQDVEDFNMKYDPRAQYTGFTYNDLVDIANNAAPGLKGTPQYEYYREIAKRELITKGVENPTDDQINKQLSTDVANSQIEYMIRPNPDYSLWDKEQTHRYRQQSILIARMRAANRGRSSGSGTSTKTQKGLFDYNDFLIGSTAANILGKTSWGARIGVGGVSDYSPEGVSDFMKSAQQELAEGIYNYNTIRTSLGENLRLIPNKIASVQEQVSNAMGFNYNRIGGRTFMDSPIDTSAETLHAQNLDFLSQMSIPYSVDDFAKFTKKKRDSDNSDYVLMNKNEDINRIYSADEVALTSAGVNRPNDAKTSSEKTKELRKNFGKRFVDGKTMMKSEGFVVGRVGDDGSHHIFLKIRISNKNKTKQTDTDPADFNFTNLYNEDEVIYYDMGVDTQESPDFSITGSANMNPKVTEQSIASDRAVLKDWGLSSTNVKSDESVPDIYNLYNTDEDDYLLDLMNY